jgi:hypothetical protein
MFKALEEVICLTVVTCVQSTSRATPSITWEVMKSLRARDNGPADQIGQARLSLSLRLANAIQFVSGCKFEHG